MTAQTSPDNATELRWQALQQLGWLDAPPDATLDQLVELASWTFNVPRVVLSLYGPHGVMHKAHVGLDAQALAVTEGLGAQRVVDQGFLVVNDAHQALGLAEHPWVSGAPGVRFCAAVALSTVEGHNVGALMLLAPQPRELSDHEARILTALARLAMDHMALQSQSRKLTELHEELEQAHGWLLDSVSQDALTQVANRRALMQFLDKTLALARREGQPLSLLLLDVRQFKKINESLGDAVGDRVLREVATRLSGSSRGSEMVGRMAGDEFLAVLYPCSSEQAQLAAERYVQAISSQPVALGAHGGHRIPLSLAFGLATAAHDSALTPDELYRRAVIALDHNKAHAVAAS
jgi:diguanylate cyclase (GGDEF)-like protein